MNNHIWEKMWFLKSLIFSQINNFHQGAATLLSNVKQYQIK